MIFNHHKFPRTVLAVVLLVVTGGLLVRPLLAQNQQAAAIEEIKSKAVAASRTGKFDLANDILTQAAASSTDAVVKKMAGWAKEFETQRLTFLAERQKEYDKAVKEVQKLVDAGKPAYAVGKATEVYTLAINKDALRNEAWLKDLLVKAKQLGEGYDKSEDWIHSMRIYLQLSTIEPDSADWKEKAKIATRRVRLLAMYVPDEMKRIQEADSKERDEVDKIIEPATRPAKKDEKDIEEQDQNRVNWRETLKDVKLDMLIEAIVNAKENYWRKVTYAQMTGGGFQALKTAVTTPALEKVFPGLGNKTMKANFLGALDAAIAQADQAQGDAQQKALVELIVKLKKTNDDTINLPEEVFASEFADGAFAALDPFSTVIWPQDWEEFKKTTQGEFTGVGIQIHVDESGNIKVVSPLEDSPAYKAGIKPDWIISHIDGKPAKWINVNQAVKRITGPAGTKVTLTMRKTDGEVKDYGLVREVIRVASVKGWMHKPGGGWEYFIDQDNKIAYMRLTNFSKTTAADVKQAINEAIAAGARGVIMDLRYNPGGLLNSASDVVNRFVTKGLIVSTRPDRPDSPVPSSSISAHRIPDEANCPLIVLVNQYSASASEIVSGALKDHHRAIIVGERTFGKGSVQMLYPLSGGQQAVLKLTTSHYYLPLGKCIHREENSKEWGVEPDVVVEMTPEQTRDALGARQEADVLRDPNDPAPKPDNGSTTTKPKEKKDLLGADPQLGAALLIMRLEVANTPANAAAMRAN